MERTVFIIAALFMVFSLQGQKIQQVGNELSLQYEELGDIEVTPELKLNQLYRVDKELRILESLGQPVKKSYKDHIGYEQWHYEFRDLKLSLINRNGYVQVESITFMPEADSKFKIGGRLLNSETKVKDIVSSKPTLEGLTAAELNVFITSPKVSKYPDIRFTITKDERGKKIKKIRIVFDTM